MIFYCDYKQLIKVFAMSEDPKQKYDQLKVVCKKQEAQIAKLQNEIRERCQSYLLHTSRFKKGEVNSTEPSETAEGSTKSISEINKLNQKVSSRVSSEKSRSQIIEEIKSAKILSFAVKQQIQVIVQPTKQDKTQEINETAIIIESFKDRITLLQNNKNQAVKELQKANADLKALKLKVATLEKNVDVLSKSEKKLKDKLKKIPEYEGRIDEIYIKLMKQVKQEEFNEESETDKHFNQKIEEIINWISRSKQKVDGLLEDFDKIEPSECEIPMMKPETNQITEQIPVKAEIEPTKVQIEPVESILVLQSEILNTKIVPEFEFSPTKTQSKLIGQNWTIISKLNEVDIKPFEASQVKSFNAGIEASNQKEEQESIIRALEQNSMIFEEELKQSKNQINDLKEELTINRNKNHQLAQDLKNCALQNNKVKQQLDLKVNQLSEELDASRKKTLTLEQKLQQHTSLFNQLQQELKVQRERKTQLQESLQLSRSKLSELQQLKISKEIDSLKESQQKSKLNITQADVAASKMTVTEQLEAPYFVEEELQTDVNDEYVKRSFIRKKIVRRNLSATAYRIVSKSKEEVDQILSKKITQYRDASQEKAAKLKASEKKERAEKQQSLQNGVNRISEVSEPRDSGINREEVRIIEVTTTTPNETIRSAKIYTNGGESNLSSRRKY